MAIVAQRNLIRRMAVKRLSKGWIIFLNIIESMALQTTDEPLTVHEQLVDIFESSTIEADLTSLIKRLSDIYDSSNDKGFEISFEHLLKVTLSESKRNADVTKIFSFISEFIVNLDNKYKEAYGKESSEEVEDIMHPLLASLLTNLEQWSQASCCTVRFRSCQLLYAILTYIQDHGVGELDMNVYEAMINIVEARKLDVSSNVRVHAVRLAQFFQDPSTMNDPIIAGLCWQMQHDPNPRVRQFAVSVVAACEETIIPITNRFLYDKNANVRNAALLHICNRISPRSFTTIQRIVILKQCFSDPSPFVRQNAEQRLIPVWFRAYKDKLSRFLKDLHEGNESLDNLPFISELLQVLSKYIKIAQIVDEIGLDIDVCLPKSIFSGEQVFLWRHFYHLSHKFDRLSKFSSSSEDVIDFIIKYFSNSSIEDDQTYIFNELILFLMDIIDINGSENDVMKNPFVSYEVMLYIVPLYINYAPKEKEAIQSDILEIIEGLLKILQFTAEEQKKSVILKCFAMASRVLVEENFITNSFQGIKSVLIYPYLSKIILAYFLEAVDSDDSSLRKIILKGTLDILKYYGWEIFSDLTSTGEQQFNKVLDDLLLHIEDDEDEINIAVQGMLKLFLTHHTVSPIILSKLIMFLFHPDEYLSVRKLLETFFELYGETKVGVECLCKAYLAVINILFDTNKNDLFYKDNFKDLLILKLTKKFLKKPWRLPASDLYVVCSNVIPGNLNKLTNLFERVKLIIENLQSAVFQQKNTYTKRTVNQFTKYLKKIKVTMNIVAVLPTLEKTNDDPPPLERQLFTDSYEEENSLKRDSESSSPEQNTESSLADYPSENNSTSLQESSLKEDKTLPIKTPAKGKTPLNGKLSLASKTPLSMTDSRKIRTPLPSKTPVTRKTPARSSRKTPLPVKISLDEDDFE
ncbi:condensin complex subunit 3 [Caerostris extrusa]|uniref:Condensin complex subunit 3 n=1 Tax=Caerostris extrusa TaxID=172846 RepID=A0AAV4XMQ2_CAEEX|nr:condensin complex subunit 3 [Caerostris extrusa]